MTCLRIDFQGAGVEGAGAAVDGRRKQPVYFALQNRVAQAGGWALYPSNPDDQPPATLTPHWGETGASFDSGKVWPC
jgi:hypothetical protein